MAGQAQTGRFFEVLRVCLCVLTLFFSCLPPAEAAAPARTLSIKPSAAVREKGMAKLPPALHRQKAVSLLRGAVMAPGTAADRAARSGRGFGADPLALGRSTPAQLGKKTKRVYGRQETRQEKGAAPYKADKTGRADTLDLSVKKEAPPESRLNPRRSTFSGGEHSLPYMDANTPPEISMRYRLRKNARTSLTINPQDSSSPLYRPAEQDGSVNSAGLYMDVDLRPDLQLHMGGEYSDIESRGAPASSSQGASVGLKWDF